MGNNNQCLKEPAVAITQEAAHLQEMHFRRLPVISNPAKIRFPLSTSGACIIDQSGMRVKLACVNWSGAHMCRHSVSGLDYRKLSDLCRQVRSMGFNGVRLTFSLQLFYENPIVSSKFIAANPQFIGKKAVDLFDIAVAEITRAGLMVILNNHTSTSMWCCSDDDCEGLWWTKEYPQFKWIDCLKALALRYRNNPMVIAFDLRNEIRKTPELTPSWGDGNLLTDWHRAATIAGNEILSVNPNLLIMVGGIFYQLDLTDVRYSPIRLDVPNKLVYTGHFYGFSWIVLSWKFWSYERFREKLESEQTYVRGMGVPFFLGQFGGNEQDTPWQYLMRYLKETDLDWAYWCLDGYKCDPDLDETYGLYDMYFKQIRHPWKLRDLQNIMPSSSASF